MLRLISQRFFTSSKRYGWKRWIHERSSQRYQRFFTSSKRACSKRQIHDGSFGKHWIHKDERSNVFGQYAGEYDEHRPNYPSEVFDEILRRRGETNLRVIDVATGTGRGAFAFSNYSNVKHIVATDVDTQMIKEARKGLKNDIVSFRVAKAEGVSEVLSSEEKRQFDVATVFQAFHWFDAQKVLKELRQEVLKSDGILAVAWNDRDLNVPWIVEFEELIEKYNKDYNRYQRQCDTFGPVLTEGNYFTLTETINVSHEMPVNSFEKLLAQSKTLSYVRNVIDRRDESDSLSWSHWEEDLREIVHRHHGSKPFAIPYVTRLYLLR